MSTAKPWDERRTGWPWVAALQGLPDGVGADLIVFESHSHGGDVSSLLYATPPPIRSGPKAPRGGGGGGGGGLLGGGGG